MKVDRLAYVIAAVLFLGSFGSLHKLVRQLSVELKDLQWEVEIVPDDEGDLKSIVGVQLQRRSDLENGAQKQTGGKQSKVWPATEWSRNATKKRTADKQSPKILLAIVSARDELHSRAKTIVKTWARNVPRHFVPMIFVGASGKNDGIKSGSPRDVARLSRAAGIHNITSKKIKIVVMENIVDNEYPPVYKNTGMVKRLNQIAQRLEANGQKVDWIMKVDDDAYVHFRGVMGFLETRNATKDGFYGQRGYGRPDDREGIQKSGLKGPFCMGGSGWVMSRSTLRKAAMDIDQCVATVEKSDYRKYMWHSDTVISLCVQRSTGKNCWTDNDYSNRTVPFRHNFNTSLGSLFLPDSALPNIAVMHPFKSAEVMARLHARFRKVVPAEIAKLQMSTPR